MIFFLFKQKTAYEMRISDWSSDVCSSDLDFGTAIATDGETRRGVVGLAGENMDNAADRIRTPQRRARAAHDFDALDLLGRQMREVEQPRAGGSDAHAVDQDQGLVGIGATQKNRRRRAGAAIGRASCRQSVCQAA